MMLKNKDGTPLKTRGMRETKPDEVNGFICYAFWCKVHHAELANPGMTVKLCWRVTLDGGWDGKRFVDDDCDIVSVAILESTVSA